MFVIGGKVEKKPFNKIHESYSTFYLGSCVRLSFLYHLLTMKLRPERFHLFHLTLTISQCLISAYTELLV